MNEKRVPLRNMRMEQFYRTLISDAKAGTEFCGIIYCMYWIRADRILPLYVGKAEKYGSNGCLSANLTNPRFFGRWGYPKYYHLGDLDLGLRGGKKYRTWVERLYDSRSDLRLRSETFFGAALWTHEDRCCCGTQTNVAALEGCLIRHARRFYSEINLNQKDGGVACRCLDRAG